MSVIRKAKLTDVPRLVDLINRFAAERVLLPRTAADVCDRIREFTVAEENGEIVGCGALHFYTPELSEIRSLAVLPTIQGKGLGRKLTERLLEEAAEQQLRQVFALTMVPEYFEKLGFEPVSMQSLPMKVWRDCLRCEKFFHCDEKAVAYFLERHPRVKAEENTVVVAT